MMCPAATGFHWGGTRHSSLTRTTHRYLTCHSACGAGRIASRPSSAVCTIDTPTQDAQDGANPKPS